MKCVLSVLSLASCVHLVCTKTSATTKVKVHSKKSYEDAADFHGGQAPQMLMQPFSDPPVASTQASSRQMQIPANRASNGESFLGMSGQATQGDESSIMLSRLSDAVESQSKAMVILESDFEKLSAREAAFERKEDAMWLLKAKGKVACSSYSKKGYGPISDKDTCDDACYSAEGLRGGNIKGSGASLSCSCKVKSGHSQYQTICGSSGLSLSSLAILGMLAILLRF
mmetsp:Transcript_27203/g.43652  ORF Transcript_27203/g.43652 Transcript_27203/m.43652 type:complete len:227 (+) Transcript_27203:57-737(+)